MPASLRVPSASMPRRFNRQQEVGMGALVRVCGCGGGKLGECQFSSAQGRAGQGRAGQASSDRGRALELWGAGVLVCLGP